MIQTLRKNTAGARNAAVTAYRRNPARGATGGAARTGGSAVTLPLLIYLPYAFLAAASSAATVPLTFEGLERKSWNSFHSPCPVVEPNEAGCGSDISKRKILACSSASAFSRPSGSLQGDGGTLLLGDERPPRAA